MIKIEFSGSPTDIHGAIRAYLEQASLSQVEDRPALDYQHVESDSAPSGPMHVVTLWRGVAIACTCAWFRYNPMRASANPCKHMARAQANAGS